MGRYAWIQQESVFFGRELWEAIGGTINEDYKLMVDGELWCRFFLNANLWHVDTVLGGYRVHSSNRAGLNYAQCHAEMGSAIRKLKSDLPHEQRVLFEKLSSFLQLNAKLGKLKIPIDYKRILLWLWRTHLSRIQYYAVNYDYKTKLWKKRHEAMIKLSSF